LEVWGCMRVCVNRNRGRCCFIGSAKVPFRMISEAILIPKIYARLQEIVSNLSKFYGEGPPPALAPSAIGLGLRALTGPPFSKIPGSAPAVVVGRFGTENELTRARVS